MPRASAKYGHLRGVRLGAPRIGPDGVEKKRMGPKPKPLMEKIKTWNFDKPVNRRERFPRELKIEVLVFMVKKRMVDLLTVQGHRLKRRRLGQAEDEFCFKTSPDGREFLIRPPTYQETSDWWRVPKGTIHQWWEARDTILEGTGIKLDEIEPDEPAFPDPPSEPPGPAPGPAHDKFIQVVPQGAPAPDRPTEPVSQVPVLNQVVFVGPIPANGTFIHHPSAVGNYPPPSYTGSQAWVVVYYGPFPPPMGNGALPGKPNGPPMPLEPGLYPIPDGLPNPHPVPHPHQHPGPGPQQHSGNPPAQPPGPHPHQHPAPHPNQHPVPGPHQHPGHPPAQQPVPHPIQFPGPHPHQHPAPHPNQHPVPGPHQNTGYPPAHQAGPHPNHFQGPHPNNFPGPHPHQNTGYLPSQRPDLRPPDNLRQAAQRPPPAHPHVENQGRGPRLAPRPPYLGHMAASPPPRIKVPIIRQNPHSGQLRWGTHWHGENPAPVPALPVPTAPPAASVQTAPPAASVQTQGPRPVVDLTASSPPPVEAGCEVTTPKVVSPAAAAAAVEAQKTQPSAGDGEPSPPAKEQATPLGSSNTPPPNDETTASRRGSSAPSEAPQQQPEDSPIYSPRRPGSSTTEEEATPSMSDDVSEEEDDESPRVKVKRERAE